MLSITKIGINNTVVQRQSMLKLARIVFADLLNTNSLIYKLRFISSESVQLLVLANISASIVTEVDANVETAWSSWVGTSTEVDVKVILIVSEDVIIVDAHSRNTLAG